MTVRMPDETRIPLRERMAQIQDRMPKAPTIPHGELVLEAWGGSSSSLESVELLPGRVLVEPISMHASDLIITPHESVADRRKNTIAKARILKLGPPKRKEHEYDGLKVGDVVLHVGQHQSRTVEIDGQTLRAIARSEIQAVICE